MKQLGAWLLNNVTSPTHYFLPALLAFSPCAHLRIEKARSNNQTKMQNRYFFTTLLKFYICCFKLSWK